MNRTQDMKVLLDHIAQATFGRRNEAGRCVSCGVTVDPNSFKDELSEREYGISGFCQACQDDAFSEPEE